MKIRFLVLAVLAALFSVHASANHGKIHLPNKTATKAEPKKAEKEKPTGSIGAKLKKQPKK